MTDTSHTFFHNEPVGKLENEAVLTAVTALCGPDHAVAAQLHKGLKRLIASDNWSEETQLDRFGLPSRYCAGTLREVLNIPGNLVLLRNIDSGFRLLHRMEQRWKYLA